MRALGRSTTAGTLRRCALLAIAAALAWLATPSAVHASASGYGAVAQVTAPLARRLTGPPLQEQEPRRPPPVIDPASGPVVSILGGSVFSGASSFQTGGAFAYFFGDKATLGFELEGTATFGPGGRVMQGLASLMLQTGARTSKIVPYIAVGTGYVRAAASLPDATREVLDQLGIHPEPTSEGGPMIQFGGGVRFYVKPHLAFRGDVRFAQVVLDLEGKSFSDRLFPMRRIAGMLSLDF